VEVKMKKSAVFCSFILICAVSYAQNDAYMIPRRIFSGDPAVLILQLPASSGEEGDIMIDMPPENFPPHAGIDFQKITLQRSSGAGRLTIEFTAFTPGLLELPVIEIGGMSFSGLIINVDSVLDGRSSPVLSGPASSLAIPGTALMLFVTIAAAVFFILISVWFIYKGRLLLVNFRRFLRSRALFISMKITEKRLYRSVLKGTSIRIVLDKLTFEFRKFLSFLTGKNCYSMTAREIEKLEINPPFLGSFFRKCDEMRFSGAKVSQQDIFSLLSDLRVFIVTLENAGREKVNQRGEKAA
jgi:hypothetical protein